jgi:hypothetical protein
MNERQLIVAPKQGSDGRATPTEEIVENLNRTVRESLAGQPKPQNDERG